MSNSPIVKYVFLWVSIGFFLVSIAYKHFFVTIKNNPLQNSEQVSIKLEKELKSVEEPIAAIKSIIIDTAQHLSFNLLLKKTEYPYYIFSNKVVIFWSNNLYTPKYGDVLGDFHVSYIETTKGKYIARKEQFFHEKKSYDIVFLIPLVEYSAVLNEYLKNVFNEKIFSDSNFEISSVPNDQDQQIIALNELDLFSVKFGNTYANVSQTSKSIIIVFIVLSFIFVAVFIRKQLMYYIHDRNIGHGFLFLLFCIIILRSMMLITSFPFDFVYIDLFDPKHYASSLVNPSLGDLILNLISLIILGIYILNYYLHSSAIKKILKGSRRIKIIAAACAIFLVFSG